MKLLVARSRIPHALGLAIALTLFCAISAPTPLAAQANGPAPAAAPVGGSDAERAAATAEKAAIPTNSLLKMYMDGGRLMHPIALCSILLLVFVFERAISLRRGRVIPRPFVKRFLEQVTEGQIDRDEALALCEKNNSPTAEVFAGAVRKWGRSSVEVEQAIIDSGERVTNGLRRYLRLINGISTVSPLLGLLGTVFGIIQAFNGFDPANASQRADLSSGISMALITTAAGLCVAIPAMIAYLYFVGRVDSLIVEIDALGQELVNAIASDGVPSSTSRRTSTGKKKRAESDSNRGAA